MADPVRGGPPDAPTDAAEIARGAKGELTGDWSDADPEERARHQETHDCACEYVAALIERRRAVVPPPPDTAAAPTEPTEGEKRLRRLCALRRKVRNCMASSEGEAACDHYLVDLEDAVREDARLRAGRAPAPATTGGTPDAE
jgi:hypothetical protein